MRRTATQEEDKAGILFPTAENSAGTASNSVLAPHNSDTFLTLPRTYSQIEALQQSKVSIHSFMLTGGMLRNNCQYVKDYLQLLQNYL
jgi:hypothetical protein